MDVFLLSSHSRFLCSLDFQDQRAMQIGVHGMPMALCFARPPACTEADRCVITDYRPLMGAKCLWKGPIAPVEGLGRGHRNGKTSRFHIQDLGGGGGCISIPVSDRCGD